MMLTTLLVDRHLTPFSRQPSSWKEGSVKLKDSTDSPVLSKASELKEMATAADTHRHHPLLSGSRPRSHRPLVHLEGNPDVLFGVHASQFQ